MGASAQPKKPDPGGNGCKGQARRQCALGRSAAARGRCTSPSSSWRSSSPTSTCARSYVEHMWKPAHVKPDQGIRPRVHCLHRDQRRAANPSPAGAMRSKSSSRVAPGAGACWLSDWSRVAGSASSSPHRSSAPPTAPSRASSAPGCRSTPSLSGPRCTRLGDPGRHRGRARRHPTARGAREWWSTL